MTRNSRTGEAPDRVRHAAAQLQPAAATAKPLAGSTGAAAKRGVHRTRAWAAPRVEHTGQDLEDSVAPKVSALLSSVESKVIREQQQAKHQPGQRAQQLHQGGPQPPPGAGRTARAGGRPHHRS